MPALPMQTWSLNAEIQSSGCTALKETRRNRARERNEVKQLIDFMEIIIIIWNCPSSNTVTRKYISFCNGALDNLQEENVEVSLRTSLHLTK